jgi:hypothetical protein
MGNSRNKKAREMRKAGRTAEFSTGIDTSGPHWKNSPESSTYVFPSGVTVNIDKKTRDIMNSSSPGFRGAREWHPEDKAAGVPRHHTYLSYEQNCKRCEKLGDRHPESESPWK